MNGEVFCYFVDMPCKIGATAVPNEDGTFTVYVNSRLSIEKQKESYLHELRHIKGDDFYKNLSVQVIEFKAHSKGE